MKTAEEINNTIQENFKELAGQSFRPGSVLGMFTDSVSRSLEEAHEEIERAKNPHIYTNLSGDNLDKMGTFVNVPRQTGETDDTYLYRLMNWTYLKSGANLTAVNDSILNLENASDAQYYPGIHGAGTGIVYIIPKEYTEENITAALKEVKERLVNVISPESYTEYIVPTPVTLVAKLESEVGDIAYLKAAISNIAKTYINAIAPNDYMSVGTIAKQALDIDNVDYFNIDGVYMNDKYQTGTKFLQGIETKMLFQEISWED